MHAAPDIDLPNLASERLGARVVYANDEFFAEKENLVRDAVPIFDAERFTDRGKWMDGWETRRSRTETCDWAIVELGLPGDIATFDVDTSHFLGNHPPQCELFAARAPGASVDELTGDAVEWIAVTPRSDLAPGSSNLITATHTTVPDGGFTHVKLVIYPDGGVARLRVYGRVLPNVEALRAAGEVDLAALENGAAVETCNDAFFGPKDNLIWPGEPANMGEGWETRRRRTPGNDWIVVRLAAPGRLTRVQIDTTHFKGNYPESCMLRGALLDDGDDPIACAQEDARWHELVARTPLDAHTSHVYDITSEDIVSHLRLDIFPDGGIARLRAWGTAQ